MICVLMAKEADRSYNERTEWSSTSFQRWKEQRASHLAVSFDRGLLIDVQCLFLAGLTLALRDSGN